MTSKNFFIFSEVLLGMLCLQPAVVLGTQPSHSGTTTRSRVIRVGFNRAEVFLCLYWTKCGCDRPLRSLIKAHHLVLTCGSPSPEKVFL